MEDITNANTRQIAKAIKSIPKRSKSHNDHFKLKIKVKAIKHYEKSKNFCLTATTFSTSRNNIMNWYKNKEASKERF